MHITSTNVLKSALHSPLPHYQLPPDGYKMVIVVFRVGAQIPLQNFGKILIVKMSKNMQRSVHACMCMYIHMCACVNSHMTRRPLDAG